MTRKFPGPLKPERGDAQRLEVAAEWVLRLRDETTGEEDILRWMNWCEADPRNQQAFDRAQQLWDISAGLAGEVVDGELIAAQRPRFRWQDAPPRLAFAAACVLAVAIGTLWLGGGRDRVHDPNLVATPTGESVHESRLSDGSTLLLAAESVVAVHYSEHERALELQGGEAYFSVAPNPQRPFVVTAGGIRIRAVGTAFNIRRAEDRVVITVAEGTVDVYERGEAALRVSAGNQLRWGAHQRNPVVASVNPASALSWREGRLEYMNEPLSGVIADLNRYSRRKVSIHGDAIGSLRFSGTLLIDSTEEWLHALPGVFPVEVRERGSGYLIAQRQALAD